MEPNKAPKNLPNNMDVVVVIDKDKLPEDVRKMLEENLPKDVQDKVFEMLQKGKMGDISPPKKDKENLPVQSKAVQDKDNKLFAIQTGTVVGNVYTDGIYKKEEDSYTNKKDIKDLGGCC